MSTRTEQIRAQKMAFEHRPIQKWHRHLTGPAELEALLISYDAKDHFCNATNLVNYKQLVELVNRLLTILESEEESDSGRSFHPTTIQTCRCLVAAELDTLLPAIKQKVIALLNKSKGYVKYTRLDKQHKDSTQ